MSLFQNFFVFMLVATGGALGAVLRYTIFLSVPVSGSQLFPWATFIVNLIGSFLIGVTLEILQHNIISEYYRFLIVVGFLGALTTFSTYVFDILRLLIEQEYRMAFLYFLLSNIFTLLLTATGLFITKRVI